MSHCAGKCRRVDAGFEEQYEQVLADVLTVT
jgi:hypothetical protein